jgi:hypothetical protein
MLCLGLQVQLLAVINMLDMFLVGRQFHASVTCTVLHRTTVKEVSLENHTMLGPLRAAENAIICLNLFFI